MKFSPGLTPRKLREVCDERLLAKADLIKGKRALVSSGLSATASPLCPANGGGTMAVASTSPPNSKILHQLPRRDASPAELESFTMSNTDNSIFHRLQIHPPRLRLITDPRRTAVSTRSRQIKHPVMLQSSLSSRKKFWRRTRPEPSPRPGFTSCAT
jgi:hypothetical protein